MSLETSVNIIYILDFITEITNIKHYFLSFKFTLCCKAKVRTVTLFVSQYMIIISYSV